MESLIVYESPFPKRRIGRPHDGGYVIADLPGSYDVLLSGGISDDISFENHFLDLYPGVPCFAFDGTITQLPQEAHSDIQFIKKNLGSENSDSVSNLSHYEYSDMFVKIDIEGHEYNVIPQMDLSRVKQLVLEVHTPADIHLHPTYYKGLSVTNGDMFSMLNKINQTHTLVHFHANNGPGTHTLDGVFVPNVFELTYIRGLTKKRNTESFPTLLDMKNVVHKPEHTFSGFPWQSL